MSARDAAPRLGRGLAALLGEAVPSAAEPEPTAVRTVATALLEPSPFQPRRQLDDTAMAELTASVGARGILQPLLVRPHPDAPGRYQIVAGERRWRAAQAAGLHDVPALVRPLSDTEAMAAGLVENLQRQDLNAIEEAEGYQRLLLEFGMTQEAAAQTVGKSRSHVANTLRLLNLPETVKADVRGGTLTAGHARALLALADPEAAARQVIARGLNVRQTEALSTATPRTALPPADRTTLAVEHELAERLGLRVSITFDGRGGVLRIHYASLDQLDGIIALLKAGGPDGSD